MLSLGLITPNAMASEAIEQLIQETGLFDFKGCQTPEASPSEVVKALRFQNPDLILVDLNDWSLSGRIVEQIRNNLRSKVIGFRSSWTPEEQTVFEGAGIVQLLPEPFSPADLDTAALAALHQGAQAPRANLFAFVPAKAGGGCSTAALNTAALLGTTPGKRVLLIEADARSGAFSIMLSLNNHLCLHDALKRAGEMSLVDWQQMHASVYGIDLLLADPSKPAPRTNWGSYFQLLRFVEKYYDNIVVDLPEVINDATAEVARTAANVFVICTPEILSVKLANLRCQEIEAYGVPKERVQVIVTRWKRSGLSVEDVEKSLDHPVYATLGNDYHEVHAAILESRLVSPGSVFGKDCRTLSRKMSGAAEEAVDKSRFGLLRKLAR